MDHPISVRLGRLNPGAFIALLVLSSFLIEIPFALVVSLAPSLAPGEGSSVMSGMGLVGRLVLGSILVPLLETALMQTLPVWLLRDRLRLSWPWVFVSSAACFAATHSYTVGYIVSAFLAGLVLVYGYAVLRQAGRRAFLLICAVHGLHNAIVSVVR